MSRPLHFAKFATCALSVTMLFSNSAIATTVDPAPAIASVAVNGDTITDKDIIFASKEWRLSLTKENIEAITKQLVTIRLVASLAESDEEFISDRILQRQISYRMNEVIARAWLENKISKIRPTERDLRNAYESYVREHSGLEYKIRLIQVRDNETAALVISRLDRGEPFSVVAKAMSVAPSSENGGELPWLSKPIMERVDNPYGIPSELSHAVIGLEKGAWSKTPIRYADMIFIILKEDQRVYAAASFDSMREQLQEGETQKMRDNAIREILEKISERNK